MSGRLHPVYRVSSIGRPIDFRYPTNVAIAALSSVALIGGGVPAAVQGKPLLAIAASAGTAGVTVFLSWALGREIAPDDQAAAFVGTALAAAAYILLGASDLWWLAATLGMSRLVNRSVGPPAKITDSIFVVALVAFLTVRGYPLLAAIAVVALVLDAVLPRPHRPHLLFGAVALVAAIVGIVGIVGSGVVLTAGVPRWIVVVAGAASLMGALALRPPRSHADLVAEPLDHRRVQAALVLVGLCAVAASLTADRVAAVGALLGPLAAAVLFSVARRLRA